jgi:hypothetical protein
MRKSIEYGTFCLGEFRAMRRDSISRCKIRRRGGAGREDKQGLDFLVFKTEEGLLRESICWGILLWVEMGR